MKNRFTKLLPLFVALLLLNFSKQTAAQTMDESLSDLSERAAIAYLQPAVSAFGSNLNSGWFSGSPSNTLLGLTFEIKIMAAGSFFTDANRNFDVSAPYRFTSEQVDEILANSGYTPIYPFYNDLKNEMLNQEFRVRMYGPTIVGSKDEHMKIEFSGTTINNQRIASTTIDVDSVYGLLDNPSILPTPGIQLNLGTIYGTQASLRWFPSIDVEDVGTISYFGFGILHNINSWIPLPLPLNFSVGYFTQRLTVGDNLDTRATQFGFYVSRQIGIGISVTPYAGITYESSTTNVKYDYVFDTPAGSTTQHVEFDLSGENKVGITLGTRLNFFFFNIAADYKIAKTNTATVSMFFGF